MVVDDQNGNSTATVEPIKTLEAESWLEATMSPSDLQHPTGGAHVEEHQDEATPTFGGIEEDGKA